MKKSFILILTTALLLSAMASCAQTSEKKSQNMKTEKTLVAFFSRNGENYAVGHIEKGNTHIVSEMIAAETGGDLFHIDPVTPYPDDYQKCTEMAKSEQEGNARPSIKGDIAVEDYDVVFIGYPNWWSDMPMPVYTFIEKHNWQGKTVIPFCTHEGSGLSDTEQKLKAACKGATVLKGLAVRGSHAQNKQEQTLQNVKNWLSGLEY